jgi:carbonic anhydrase
MGLIIRAMAVDSCAMAEIQTLIEGYRRFHQQYFASSDTGPQQRLVQAPKTLVVACSDSRVDPSIITCAQPGDIFVARNVANLVPPYDASGTGLHGVSAALEFAVRVLEVKHIIIMGHSHCAGIAALMKPNAFERSDFIGGWMDIALPAKMTALQHHRSGEGGEEVEHICEREAIKLSLANLLTFPWIKERVAQGSLTLHGWYYSVLDGSLQQLNPENGSFEAIAA